LRYFLEDTSTFLGNVIEKEDIYGFLWKEDSDLRKLAADTFERDVRGEIDTLCKSVEKMCPFMVRSHGLKGRPLYFKLRALFSISAMRDKVIRLKNKFSVRGWLKQMFDAIDVILDSIISALGGVGGLVKEFKDMLSALVKTY